MFEGKTQEDAHEFLLSLLNSIHDDIRKVARNVSRINSKLEVTTDMSKVQDYFERHELE